MKTRKTPQGFLCCVLTASSLLWMQDVTGQITYDIEGDTFKKLSEQLGGSGGSGLMLDDSDWWGANTNRFGTPLTTNNIRHEQNYSTTEFTFSKATFVIAFEADNNRVLSKVLSFSVRSNDVLYKLNAKRNADRKKWGDDKIEQFQIRESTKREIESYFGQPTNKSTNRLEYVAHLTTARERNKAKADAFISKIPNEADKSTFRALADKIYHGSVTFAFAFDPVTGTLTEITFDGHDFGIAYIEISALVAKLNSLQK